jgi:6-pyruvoyltetrahydropterin/6-carboxytetrahydropterin synthase
MVINLSDLKVIIKTEVLDILDHKNLDKDIPEFEGVVSTTENLAVFIWNTLEPRLKDLLYEVKIHETENNVVIYKGEAEQIE